MLYPPGVSQCCHIRGAGKVLRLIPEPAITGTEGNEGQASWPERVGYLASPPESCRIREGKLPKEVGVLEQKKQERLAD